MLSPDHHGNNKGTPNQSGPQDPELRTPSGHGHLAGLCQVSEQPGQTAKQAGARLYRKCVEHRSINSEKSLKNKENMQPGLPRKVPTYGYCPGIIVNNASSLLNVPIWILYCLDTLLETVYITAQ